MSEGGGKAGKSFGGGMGKTITAKAAPSKSHSRSIGYRKPKKPKKRLMQKRY